MSSTASNYNLTRLYAGIALSATAFAFSLMVAFAFVPKVGSTGVWTSLVAMSYGTMMFASSFVEEEQHFWYWAASAWFAWITVKKYELKWLDIKFTC